MYYVSSRSSTISSDLQKKLPLIYGNTKLGPIWHFSLPSISTCPGHTPECSKLCYALMIEKRRSNVRARYELNDAMRHHPRFVARVISQITVCNVATVRIHVSGDFDDIEYIRQWREIASRRPNTHFFAYTRSWSKVAAEYSGQELFPELRKLAAMKNFSMWWSCDRDTGRPPRTRGVRHAYMARDDNDIPDYLPDLVFRNYRHTYKLSQGNTLVCPEERIVKSAGSNRVTCATCRLCFSRSEWIDQYNLKLREESLAATI